MPPVRHVRLPGPDRPPKRKKRYPAPKGYIGGWRDNPGLSPKKYKTVKTGKDYYIAKALKPKGSPKPKAKAKAPAAPKPPPGPYDKYKGTPFEGYFERLDLDQAHHEAYAKGLLPTISSGLAAITGINPAAPGYNPTIQQQYLANVQGSVGNALNASAAATPMMASSLAPGGAMAAPNAYQGAAMREYAAQRGGAAILNAQAQAALNTVQPNIAAQAAYSKAADLAAGLPRLYADRRSEEMMKIDQFLAEAAETARHNKVTEAISAQNAATNAAIQFGRLGLSADELAGEQASDAAERGQDAAARNAPAPYGYVRDPATGDLKRDPSVPQASASSGGGSSGPSASKGQYPPNKLRKEGFVGGWKVKPKNVKGSFVRATDGTWWIKPKGSSGSTPKTAENLREELNKWYYDKIDGEYDIPAAVRRVGNWILARKGRFVKGGKVDIRAIDALLTGVIGTGDNDVPEKIIAWLKPYIRNGRWR